MKHLVIFSGTTEGRELSVRMAEAGVRVTVCVATLYGREEQPTHPNLKVRVGSLSAEEKRLLLWGSDLCVDATHPYATHVTESVRNACKAANIPYLRLLRQESNLNGTVEVSDASAAADYLREREGNVLLTTGAKELTAFAALDPTRLYPRVLPSHESLRACEAMKIPHRNVIAMQGPFTKEMNEATLRQYRIQFLVTKDGGIPGGFPEKAQAAKQLGITMIVLRRPEENGKTYEEVLQICKAALLECGD